jgi:hypothetical protein
MVSRHPFALNFILLALALLASLAIGAVFIPPVSLLKLVTANISSLLNTQDVPETFHTILFSLRLP